jgi:hypothetical protein
VHSQKAGEIGGKQLLLWDLPHLTHTEGESLVQGDFQLDILKFSWWEKFEGAPALSALGSPYTGKHSQDFSTVKKARWG